MNSGIKPRKSPYQGLIPYGEADADFFFGREKDTRLIIANLFSSPLTILYGPSGVGKSSVLHAGVLHQLSRRSDLAVRLISEWKADPLATLKSAMNTLPGLNDVPDMTLPLPEYLAECSSRLERRLMIILDQFEEFFLYHPNEDEFTVQFSRAVMQPGFPISFLLSIREDGLAKLDRFEGRIPILFDNYLRLEHLDEAAARSAIENPIRKYNELYVQQNAGYQIEHLLVEEVIKQLRSGQVSMPHTGHGMMDSGMNRVIETPYLQLVMERLWQAEIAVGSRTLRLGALHSLGDAERIVRTHLDSAFGRLTYSQRFLAMQVLQYLVTPTGTKIALKPTDLANYTDTPAANVQLLLQRLAQPDIRLLRAVQTSGSAEMNYEIFHDVLAAPILDWRAREARSSRTNLVVLGFFLALCAFLYVCLVVYLSMYSEGGFAGDIGDFSEALGGALIPGVCALMVAMLSLAIGLYIGRGWIRTK